MDWIKKNYDKFVLALSAVALIAVGVMLFLSAQGFGEKFSEIQSTPPKNDTIPAVDTAKIKEAQNGFVQPVKWESDVHSGLLFKSERYVVKESKLEKIATGAVLHSRTKEPMPNAWFLQYKLNPVDKNVGTQDPDGDGFLTEDEFLAKTNPTDKTSLPPYHTLLFVKNWITTPFRWEFKGYNGNPSDPSSLTFQINPMDLRGGVSEFLPLGKEIPRTGFTIKSFNFKEVENPATGGKTDVSEVILENTVGESLVLPLLKIVQSPSQIGEFEYRLHKKTGEAGEVIRVPRLGEFVLKPAINVRYKLLDGNQENAVIQLPDGQKYTVPKLTAQPAPAKAPEPAPAPSTPPQ